VRDNAYLAYLRRQPCQALGEHSGPIQAAHLRYADLAVGRSNPGLSRKSDDRWATSLCAGHHAEQHAHGNERQWWERMGLNAPRSRLASTLNSGGKADETRSL
jgi:hypothetical protein